uniref:Putative paramyosin n=1 Tax=Triatoma infestans TaxID=30076 RepID=A0A023EX35_TRIIF
MKDHYELYLYDKLCIKEACQPNEDIKKIIRNAVVTGDLSFGGRALSLKTCKILSQIIRKSSNIHIANFSDCMLNPDALGFIIESIMCNHSIKELNLFGNHIKNENVPLIGKLLSTNPSIKTLILKWNSFGESVTCFAAFCDGLGKSESLQYLDLRNNELCENCISHLANALKNNASLTHLDLRWNNVSNNGAKYLLQALEENSTLKIILLEGNHVHTELSFAIEKCLKDNLNLSEKNVEYEEKIVLLKARIQALEETHVQNVEIIKESAEKRIMESQKRLADLENEISQYQKTVQNLEEKVSALTSHLNQEKQKSENMDVALKEREKAYSELSQEYHSSVKALKKALHEKELEQLKVNSHAHEKLSKHKELLGKVEAELEAEKMKNTTLINEIVWLKNKVETTVQQKTETYEIERDMWRKKYDELESSSSAQLQRMKSLALDKQQSLENTIMELSERQANNIMTLTERCERVKQEKAMLDEQLTSLQNTVITLQRENTSLIGQIAEPARKVTSLLEELSNERITLENMKQQKHNDEKTIHDLKSEVDKFYSQVNILRKNESDIINKFEDEISKLKEKNRHLQKKLERKQQRITDIRNKEKERMKMLHSAVNKFLDRLSPSPVSSQDS